MATVVGGCPVADPKKAWKVVLSTAWKRGNMPGQRQQKLMTCGGFLLRNENNLSAAGDNATVARDNPLRRGETLTLTLTLKQQ